MIKLISLFFKLSIGLLVFRHFFPEQFNDMLFGMGKPVLFAIEKLASF